MTDIEERLRTELAELADWFTDEPKAGAETSTPENRSHRSRWPLVAAACAALIAGAVGASVLVEGSGRDVSSFASTEVPVGGSAQPAGPAGTSVPLVLEGETVLSESPLTVAGAPAPALAVAPEAWGEQVVVEPMDSIDAAFEQHLRDVTDQVQRPQGDLELIKTTLVGRIAGQPWVIQVLEGPAPGPGSAPGSVLRVRSVSSPDAGFSAAGETVFGESLEWIAPLPVASAPRPVDVGYSTPEGWLTWDLLPAETAAVTFRDNDDRLWTQPVAGFAALPVALDPGERFTVEALDRRGNALWTITQTAEGPPPLPQLVGQDLDAVLGPGLDARELSATSTNGYTIIVVGASWCLPCFEHIDEIQRALQQAADSGAAIVSIDASGDPEAFWPDPTSWPFERLRAPDGRLITNVGAVPTFLLVDADLKVIDATLGVHELRAIANKAQN